MLISAGKDDVGFFGLKLGRILICQQRATLTAVKKGNYAKGYYILPEVISSILTFLTPSQQQPKVTLRGSNSFSLPRDWPRRVEQETAKKRAQF